MKIVSVVGTDVVPENVLWLEEKRIPLGEITIVGGVPGLGKTQYALGVAAEATRGKLVGHLHGKPVDVAYISAEDSVSRTLQPRFLAAGGDPARVHFYKTKHAEAETVEDDPVIELPDDLEVIREWLTRTGAHLLVLDPVIAMIPAALNSHKDQHVRRALAPLARMCHELNVAVIVVMHLSKDRDADALNRINGSIGFAGAARSVLLFARDPEDVDGETGGHRVLAHAKSNLGPQQQSVSYTIEQRIIDGVDGPIETSIAVRQGESTYGANDLIANTTSNGEASACDEAREFLLAELTAGAVLTRTLKTNAEDGGVKWRTVERAKKQLPIKTTKTSGGWEWSLKTASPSNGNVGGLGGLQVVNTANSAKVATANGIKAGDVHKPTDMAVTIPSSPQLPQNALTADVEDEEDARFRTAEATCTLTDPLADALPPTPCQCDRPIGDGDNCAWCGKAIAS